MGYSFYYPPENKVFVARNVEFFENSLITQEASGSHFRSDSHKWLFKKKTDMDGVVHTYKAHLVAKGFTQTPGINYEETFSLVQTLELLGILIAIAAFYGDYGDLAIGMSKTAFP
ncbi:retrotransposon protein, putative, ty1-copia subclass [Tanacetum coccineum]